MVTDFDIDDSMLRTGVLTAIEHFDGSGNSNRQGNIIILPPFNMNVAIIIQHTDLWYPGLAVMHNNKVDPVTIKPLDIYGNLMVQYCQYVSEQGQL